MPPDRIVKALDKIKHVRARRVAYAFRAVRSVLSDEKKLSMTALSHTLPDRLMLQVMPSAFSAR